MNRLQYDTALRAYEAMIRVITKGAQFIVSPVAPNTFGALQTAYARDGYLTVYDGGCDNTIFSSPEVNHLFRVWHDSVHILLCANFSVTGETDVYDWQVHEMVAALRAFNYSETVIGHVISIMTQDIMGQVLYYNEHKQYVENQREFMFNHLGLN